MENVILGEIRGMHFFFNRQTDQSAGCMVFEGRDSVIVFDPHYG